MVVLAATLAFGALASIWSVTAPLGEAPDEPAHLALVLHLADGNPYPDYDGLHNQAAIIRLCRTFASATRACPREGEPVTATSFRRHPAEEAPDKASRPAWDDEGGAEALGQLNQMPQHPPLYYQAMATVLRVERAITGGPASADRELALLRLVNVLLILPLPLLAWWAARRFGLSEATAVTASVALFAVPMLTHIGATLNNDNLLTLLCALVLALCAGVVRGDRSLRTALAIGVATGLALLTKAFAATLPVVIVAAYAVGLTELVGERWLDRARRVVRPLLAAGGTVLVLAGWWYVGVRQRTGSFTPSIEAANLTSALQPPGFSPSAGEFAGEFTRNLNTRFWGSFGWYTIRFPAWLALICTLVVAAAVVTALLARRDEGGSTRLQRAFLLVPFLLLFGFVLARAWSLYATTSKFPFIQGRYLFAGIVGLMVLVALGFRRWSGRWAPLVVAGLAALVQLEALRRCLQGWWGGPGLGPRGQIEALVAWSAWPGELLALLAVAAGAAGAWFAFSLVRFVIRSGDDVPVGSFAT
jgi:4-amino-4-deoxy-L-arabinose transferase-like glycosyltransferase